MKEFGADLPTTGKLYKHKGTGQIMRLVRSNDQLGTFRTLRPQTFHHNGEQYLQWKAICRMDNMTVLAQQDRQFNNNQQGQNK